MGFHHGLLAPAQVDLGARLNEEAGLEARVRLAVADCRALPFADGEARGAYAIESRRAERVSWPAAMERRGDRW